MISIDITCDLHDRDETGFIWTYLDEARDPTLIEPGAIVIAGEPDVPAVAEVMDVTEGSTGTIVHLRLLPGTLEDYIQLAHRATAA
ncbi:MAG: hypothetical protein J2P58_08825 [Acidimicrobiaceae bacterium]|nr:hypothetical protein [Acidimicrobiaceae bacterium]